MSGISGRVWRMAVIAGVVLSGVYLAAQVDAAANLMPVPQQVERGDGALTITPQFSVKLTGYREPRLDRAVARFYRDLAWRTGIPMTATWAQPQAARLAGKAKAAAKERAESAATLEVHTGKASAAVQEIADDESYSLTVTSSGAKIDAPTPLGAMHGLQTLLQMVTDSGGSAAPNSPSGFVIPAATIHDQPRFPWRGLMMDVSRHFMPVEVVERNLNGMAAVKMNVLHWHLSDDQGFRAESKRFPKLTGMGSDGLYYTQAQIREVIAYAHDRGIRVVPEFDMPGHSASWLAGYPEIGSGPKPYEILHAYAGSGRAIDPTKPATFKLLAGFVAEMAKLFPDHYFHIGGDEVEEKIWDDDAAITAYKQKHNIKTNAELQAQFNQKLEKMVQKGGKTMMGWDEILNPDLSKSVLLHSWRGQESLAKAAQQGIHGLLSFGYYLDLSWPAERHYAVDPLSGPCAELTPEQQKLILGGEAAMWSEYVSPETVDSRIWPRAAVVAERLWSAQSVTDVDSMYRRMQEVSWRLDGLGLTHNSSYATMLHRIANGSDERMVRLVADSVEPVKDYARASESYKVNTHLTPMTRLVDAARPESLVPRRFNQLAAAYAKGSKDPIVAAELRRRLVAWRDQEAALAGQSTGLMSDIAAVSGDLAEMGRTGLAAMDAIDGGKVLDAAWYSQAVAALDRASRPRALVLLTAEPGVRALVDAAASAAAVK